MDDHSHANDGISLGKIAQAVGGTLSAALDDALLVRTVASLADAEPTDISWVDGKKWLRAADASRAGVIIGTRELLGANHDRALFVEDTQVATAEVLALFAPARDVPDMGIHPTAVVHDTAVVAESARIGPLVRIGAGARVGDETIVHSGVSIGAHTVIGEACELFDGVVVYERCTIGNRVRLHANAVIGADGFGYFYRNGQHCKLPHIGTVEIEDDVEVGANTTIDRAKVGKTLIERGTKIDNLVMVAHNVQIGPLCVIVGQVGISGSVRMGAGCVVGGQVGVSDGVHIADGTQVSAMAGVMNDVKVAGSQLYGVPAQDHMTAKRELLSVRRLPKTLDRISELEKKVAQLEGAANDREAG